MGERESGSLGLTDNTFLSMLINIDNQQGQKSYLKVNFMLFLSVGLRLMCQGKEKAGKFTIVLSSFD